MEGSEAKENTTMVQPIIHNCFVGSFPRDAAGRLVRGMWQQVGTSCSELESRGHPQILESILSRTVTGCIYVFRRCSSLNQLPSLV